MGNTGNENNTNDIANEKAKQIAYYYFFHKKIEKIFKTGFNPFFNYENTKIYNPNEEIFEETFYIIDEKWINLWKIYSGYIVAKEYFDKIEPKEEKTLKSEVTLMCNNMIMTGEINDCKDVFIPKMENERCGRLFCNKTIYKLSDFDCLVDENTFNLFSNLSGYDFFNIRLTKTKEIKGKILDKMIYLLFKDQNKIKLFYEGQIEEEKELIQLTLDFNFIKEGEKFNQLMITTDKSEIKFKEYIFNELRRKKTDELINFFNNQGICYKTEVKGKFDRNSIKFYYLIINETLYYLRSKRGAKNNIVNLSNINKAKYTGFANIDSTMNATLSCLINIDLLTRYLLTKTNYNNIINNIDSCELLSSYVDILMNIWCNEKIDNFYKPEKFKKIIIEKNPLFSGTKTIDSKDRIKFLLEEMSDELNKLISLTNNNFNNSDNNLNIEQMDQSNKFLMFESFINNSKNNNDNIITKLFSSTQENVIKCEKCQIVKYYYQICFSL